VRAAMFVAFLAMTSACATARARIVEDSIEVPVRILNSRGGQVERQMHVSLFHENKAPKPYPVAVLNHGRSGYAAERAALRTGPYAPAARWLAGFGFMVAVPVRVGYGETGGEDVEDSGPCNHKNYRPGFEAAAAQTLAVLEELRKRGDIAKDRAIVVGQSYGGTTAITIAARSPPGLQGAINFAGGGGGGPKSHPQRPCAEPLIKRLFASYGKTARIPTLWIYSENDMYFGPKFPPEWFNAFKASGGNGEFVMFPPVSDNGHLTFSRGTRLWEPRVQKFLASLGYTPLSRVRPGK
jgi:dienelactone hydrolase